MKIRPWYISLAAIWDDDANAANCLDKKINEFQQPALFPFHHVNISSYSRHTTILAILLINYYPSTTCDFREYSRQLISSFESEANLIKELTEIFGKGIQLKAYELKVFDNGTAIQFKGNQKLADFRIKALGLLSPIVERLTNSHKLLSPIVERLTNSHSKEIIENILNDNDKNCGINAYGSIARSPCRSDSSIERFRLKIEPNIDFNFNRIHLLTSDESLSNPRIPDREDFIIGC